QLFEKAKANDKDANQMIDSWTSHIAEGLEQIINIVVTRVLLIGGGVSKQDDFLLENIEHMINNFLSKNFNQTLLKCSHLRYDAALYGAVANYFKLVVFIYVGKSIR